MSGRTASFTLAALLALAGAAHAQDAAPGATPGPAPAAEPAPAPDVEPALEDGYPTALHLRPLVLPAGMFEVGAHVRSYGYGGDTLSGDDFETFFGGVSARAGAGPVELVGRVDMVLESPYFDAGEVERVYGAVVAPIGPGALTAGVTFYAPGEYDFKIFEPVAMYTIRTLTGPSVSVDLGGGIRHNHYDYGSTTFDLTHAEARAGGQAQINPQLGVTGGVRLSIPVAASEEFANEQPATALDMRLVYTTRALDAYAGLEVTSFQYGSVREVSVGVIGRLP